MTSSLGVISGPAIANYHFGDKHPFGPLRHQAFLDGMNRLGLNTRVNWLEPVSCNLEDLLAFHIEDFVERIRQGSDKGEGFLDFGDTPARAGIFEAACHVVGSAVHMTDLIMQGSLRRGFVPIGGLHHGYRDHCSGFCIFNDICIAIEHLRRVYGLERILYVDIDAHHGDGVFYNYESDSQVFIVDFHEDGQFLYPGTGDADETGTGPAQGTKMNFPLPMQANDKDFAQQWASAELFIRSIEPDFIILQCGADSMQGDPITHLSFTTESYRLASSSLSQLADEYCEGRMLGLGGGGYNMDNISKAWPVVVEAMLR